MKSSEEIAKDWLEENCDVIRGIDLMDYKRNLIPELIILIDSVKEQG